MNQTTCPSCKQAIATRDFLAACSHYWAAVDAVKFTCPKCRKDTDARIEGSGIWLGYVYAAGSVHFCGMDQIKVEGLQAWREGEGLTVQLLEETWTISATAKR
jgi:ribosomal protein L37AE/L43A